MSVVRFRPWAPSRTFREAASHEESPDSAVFEWFVASWRGGERYGQRLANFRISDRLWRPLSGESDTELILTTLTLFLANFPSASPTHRSGGSMIWFGPSPGVAVTNPFPDGRLISDGLGRVGTCQSHTSLASSSCYLRPGGIRRLAIDPLGWTLVAGMGAMLT